MGVLRPYRNVIHSDLNKENIYAKLSDCFSEDFSSINSDEGHFSLIPKFNLNLAYNSFVPNVDVDVTEISGSSEVTLSFKPTKSVERIFLLISVGLILFQIALLGLLLYSFIGDYVLSTPILLMFLPTFLLIFAYLLLFIGFKISSRRMFADIKNALVD